MPQIDILSVFLPVVQAWSQEDTSKRLLKPEREQMSDQSTIPPKPTQMNNWVLLELLTGVWVRDYLQKLKCPKDNCITKNPIAAWVATHKTWKPGVQGTTCRHLNGLEIVHSRKLLVSSFPHSSSCVHLPQVIWLVWAIQSLSAVPTAYICLEKEGPRE